MATLSDIGNAYSAPTNGALFVRLIGGCVEAAGAILTEPANTPNHLGRLSWAKGILSDDQSAVYQRVRQVNNFALATNADVQFDPANVTDSSLVAAVQQGIAQFAPQLGP